VGNHHRWRVCGLLGALHNEPGCKVGASQDEGGVKGMMAQRSNLTESFSLESLISEVWLYGGDEVRRVASPRQLETIQTAESEYGCSLEDLAVHCKIAECIHDFSISDALRKTKKVNRA
jgi:hypothetical protein